MFVDNHLRILNLFYSSIKRLLFALGYTQEVNKKDVCFLRNMGPRRHFPNARPQCCMGYAAHISHKLLEYSLAQKVDALLMIAYAFENFNFSKSNFFLKIGVSNLNLKIFSLIVF